MPAAQQFEKVPRGEEGGSHQLRLGQIFLILLTPQQLISENLQIVAPSPTEAPGHRHRTQTIHRHCAPSPREPPLHVGDGPRL